MDRAMRLCVTMSAVIAFGCASVSELDFSTQSVAREDAVGIVETCLDLYVYKTKGPKVEGSVVSWYYQIHDPDMRWVPKHLDLVNVDKISGGELSGNRWRVILLTATDEEIEFVVESREWALKLGGAFKTLSDDR